MPDVGFGTYGSGTRNTSDSPLYSDGIGLPTGRVCSDGANRAAITALLANADRYNSGSSVMSLTLGSSGTGNFGIGGGGPTAGSTGWIESSLWVVSDGSARFTIGFNARTQFGGAAPGSGIYDGVGFFWAGMLSGAYRFIQPPAAPAISSVTSSADGTSATIVHSTPADTGQSALTGSRIQRATNLAFTTGLATVDATGLSTVMTGLTPGVTYHYRTTSRNALTDTAGVLGGAWSASFTRQQADPIGLGRQFRGASMVEGDGRRFNGSLWQDLEGRRFDGSIWGEIGR